MVEYDTGDNWLDAYLKRMEKNGAVVTDVSYFREWESYAINFRLGYVDDGEILGSSMEIQDDKDVEIAVFRLPTIVVDDEDEYDDVKEEVEDSVSEAIAEEFDLEYEYGVIQDDNVRVRSARAWESNDFTTHIEFTRDLDDGTSILDSNDVIRVLRVLSDVWENELFMYDVAKR